MYYNQKLKLFSECDLREILEKIRQKIKSEIDSESDNYLLNANETQYIEHLVENHKLDIPILHFEKVYADSVERDIPAEYFPVRFHVRQGQKYRRDVIIYFIPVSGDVELLKCRPESGFTLNGYYETEYRENSICFEFINFNNNPQEINQNYQNTVRSIANNYNTLRKDCENFNSNLYNFVESNLNQRKQIVQNKNNLLSSLGVPLRKKTGVSDTFSVPSPKVREKIIVKPVVHEKGFKPEPCLDIDNYNKILKIIDDVGKNFERMPSVYKEKEEEHLRDHILLTLDPNFELGSATAETFNKKGKTDIQLRYDSSVVFIAECKFWKGEKQLLKTIDQLLGYLTWRDTKSALIIFVKNKEISTVLEKIEEKIQTHSNYIAFVNKKAENWINYRFHIEGDKNRETKMALMVYHISDYEK